MYSLTQGGYTHNQVLKILQSSRTLKFRYELLDKNEIKLKDLKNVSGSLKFDSNQEIMGTASFTIKGMEDINDRFIDLRIRPFMAVKVKGQWLEYPLGTYIMSSPEKMRQGSSVIWNVECYDYNTILKEDKNTKRMFIPVGQNYVRQVRNILNDAGIKKINVETSALTVKKSLEFEIGTNKLEIINSLLEAINYEPLHFNNTGYAISKRYIEPLNRRTEQAYRTDDFSIIKSGSKQSIDLYNVPNIFVRYTDDPDGEELRSEYINDDSGSAVSTVNRGRNIVDIQSVNDIADKDTLNAMVRRIAIEKSQTYDTITLLTALMPHHSYRDCIYVEEKTMKIGNKYIEYAWEMPLDIGATMTHTLKRVIKL